jgi:hypothetical protein
MNEQEQRIAIAQACGFYQSDGEWHFPNGAKLSADGMHEIPDYLNDLNAMNEAEIAFIANPKLEYKYGEMLARMTIGPERDEKGFAPNGWGYFAVASATAAERAEAFLRTLNLWKP